MSNRPTAMSYWTGSNESAENAYCPSGSEMLSVTETERVSYPQMLVSATARPSGSSATRQMVSTGESHVAV
jgi:hypothetical protein